MLYKFIWPLSLPTAIYLQLGENSKQLTNCSEVLKSKNLIKINKLKKLLWKCKINSFILLKIHDF